MKLRELKNEEAVYSYVFKKVIDKIYFNYSHPVFEDNEEVVDKITKKMVIEYGVIIDDLIENNELHDLNSANRNNFIYGSGSINDGIIYELDKVEKKAKRAAKKAQKAIEVEDDLPF